MCEVSARRGLWRPTHQTAVHDRKYAHLKPVAAVMCGAGYSLKRHVEAARETIGRNPTVLNRAPIRPFSSPFLTRPLPGFTIGTLNG
jgi:hypothetical protein